MNPITLTEEECALLDAIAEHDNTDWRKALHDAIFLFASEVDYTRNLETKVAKFFFTARCSPPFNPVVDYTRKKKTRNKKTRNKKGERRCRR